MGRAGEQAGGGVVGFLSLLIVVSSVVKVDVTLCWKNGLHLYRPSPTCCIKNMI